MITQKISNGIFIILAIALMWGCSEDDNGNPSPVPDNRDKFAGSWNVNNETCAKAMYVVSMSKDESNADQVLITNFAFSNSSEPSIGVVTGSTISIPKQTNSEGWSIEGSGLYKENGSISWNYTLIISGYQEQCTCIYLR